MIELLNVTLNTKCEEEELAINRHEKVDEDHKQGDKKHVFEDRVFKRVKEIINNNIRQLTLPQRDGSSKK